MDMGQEMSFDVVLKILDMDEETYMLWSLNNKNFTIFLKQNPIDIWKIY